MDSAAALPVVLDYISCDEQGLLCNLAHDFALLDKETGKTRTLFQLVLEACVHSEVEDLVIAVAADSVAAIEKGLNRKKKMGNLRVHFVQPQHGVSLGDLLRQLHRSHLSLLARGFVYLNGHCLPSDGWKAFAKTFKTMTSKQNAALLLLSEARKPSQRPKGSPRGGVVLVVEKKTQEVLGFQPWRDGDTFDINTFCKDNKRVITVSEGSATVSSGVDVILDQFLGNSKLLEGFSQNHDFNSLNDFISLALSQPVQLDGIFLQSIGKKSNTKNGTIYSPFSLLSSDCSAASDAIELEGNKSYWRRTDENSFTHESVVLGETSQVKLVNSILMKDARVGSAEVVQNSIIGPHTEITGAKLVKNCVVLGLKGIPVKYPENVDYPCLIASKALCANIRKFGSVYEALVDMDDHYSLLKCSDAWYQRYLAPIEMVAFKLLNDPMEDLDNFWDTVFDLNEEADVGEEEKLDSDDFAEEVLDILGSGEEGHMADLILELRTLRLSENKKNEEVMKPLGSFCVSRVKSKHLKTSAEVAKYFKRSGLSQVVEAFHASPECAYAFYEGVLSAIDAEQTFVVVVSALNEALDTADTLPNFVQKTSDYGSVLKSALVRNYLEWLAEEFEDDESSLSADDSDKDDEAKGRRPDDLSSLDSDDD